MQKYTDNPVFTLANLNTGLQVRECMSIAPDILASVQKLNAYNEYVKATLPETAKKFVELVAKRFKVSPEEISGGPLKRRYTELKMLVYTVIVEMHPLHSVSAISKVLGVKRDVVGYQVNKIHSLSIYKDVASKYEIVKGIWNKMKSNELDSIYYPKAS